MISKKLNLNSTSQNLPSKNQFKLQNWIWTKNQIEVKIDLKKKHIDTMLTEMITCNELMNSTAITCNSDWTMGEYNDWTNALMHQETIWIQVTYLLVLNHAYSNEMNGWGWYANVWG